ncbi:MAG: divergent polysaccharide deacetylase family protein [Gammaproteobacteria bacterium]|nr:divergent polysaccharide deacetylase family protein [Gammaproteobacteria bacterium]
MTALHLTTGKKMHTPALALTMLMVGWVSSTAVFAATPPDPPTHSRQPAIGIIIDDMGNLEQRDKRALQLPGPITFAFLPRTPHARKLAELAHQLNKEVMLHLPMQPIENNKVGPGALTLHMTARQFEQQLTLDFAAIPHIVGINNHMGSLLTQHPGHMQWLMTALSKREDLYFVDSYTSKNSIAQQLANENHIPNMRRDVFLDHDRNPDTIRFHLQRLINKARKNGTALAIGHPFPETIAVLKEELPKLHAQGIILLPVSQLVHRTLKKRSTSWQASLSR